MPGIDQVTMDDFAADLGSGLRCLAQEIAAGRYRSPSEGEGSPTPGGTA